MGTLIKKYKHSFVLLYMLVYFTWFFKLENRSVPKYHIISCKIDQLIPFNEYFVIPYILWFVYISVVVVYLMLTSVEDFYKCTIYLFVGMTICLIIYTVWPNEQQLRVSSFEHENVFTHLVNMFYLHDTPTNVCPSIHVYNSIGAHLSIMHCKKTKNKRLITISSFILMILICLSTMFIKQHSFIDVICACILSILIYIFVYKINYKNFLTNRKAAHIH